MKIATAHLKSISPYSQSRYHGEEMKPKELDDVFERRVWRSRMHVDNKGNVFIPPMAIKHCIAESAKFRGERIPGQGQANWTKHFAAGLLCIDPIELGIKADDVQGESLFLNANGKPGPGTRVIRIYPRIDQWKGVARVMVLDDLINEEIFLTTLREAGQLIGIGRFRPINRGFYGRFIVEKLEWQDAT